MTNIHGRTRRLLDPFVVAPHSDAASRKQAAEVRRIVRRSRVALLSTQDVAGTLHAWPLEAFDRTFDGELWFKSSESSAVLDDVLVCPDVQVTYLDEDSKRAIVLDGVATASWGADFTTVGLQSPRPKGWATWSKRPGAAVIRVKVLSAHAWE